MKPHTVFYGSSYDRGLEHLLKIWPDVKKEIPDAELHIYYGWKLFEKFYRDNPERMAWMAKMNKMMEYPGIKHHGRVPQPVLRKEMKNYAIFAYPAHFGEISCITAMRAQAVGCIPVVVDYAALESTVQFGVKVHGDIYDPKVLNEYKEELIALMKDEKRQKEIREKMVPWAKEMFPWSKVAQQWSNLFKGENVTGLIPTS